MMVRGSGLLFWATLYIHAAIAVGKRIPYGVEGALLESLQTGPL